MNRLVNELESRDSEWKSTPLAGRNRALLKKWKTQIKVNGPFSYSGKELHEDLIVSNASSLEYLKVLWRSGVIL